MFFAGNTSEPHHRSNAMTSYPPHFRGQSFWVCMSNSGVFPNTKHFGDYDPINAHYIWDLYRIFPYRGMFGIGVHPTITLQATGRFSPPPWMCISMFQPFGRPTLWPFSWPRGWHTRRFCWGDWGGKDVAHLKRHVCLF